MMHYMCISTGNLRIWRRFLFAIFVTATVSFSGNMLLSAESDSVPGESPMAKARLIEARANGPFYFYGKIVDQYDHPVAGASATLRVGRVVAGPSSAIAKTEHIFATSDESGQFSFIDVTGYLFVITLKCSGYLIDDHHLDLNYQYNNTIKCDQLSGKQNPHVLRAWKLGEPLENRKMELGGDAVANTFKADDKRELFGTIKMKIEMKGETKRLLDDPVLRVGANNDGDEWDVALSLVSGSLDIGEAPFSDPGDKPLQKGAAVHVRTRRGGICQADPTFPFTIRKTEASQSIDLKWKNCIKIGQDVFFRVFYYNQEIEYSSFITIRYQNAGRNENYDCQLNFCGSGGLTVPQLGIVNVSGAGNLEYFPDFIRTIDARPDAERRERILHYYQEHNLPEIRLKDPALAREIEARMRAEGKEIP
jgi:hypothetical protein